MAGERYFLPNAFHHVGQCVLRLGVLLLLEMRVAFLEVEFLQIGVVQLVGVHLGEFVRHGLEPLPMEIAATEVEVRVHGLGVFWVVGGEGLHQQLAIGVEEFQRIEGGVEPAVLHDDGGQFVPALQGTVEAVLRHGSISVSADAPRPRCTPASGRSRWPRAGRGHLRR
jgi:hypothetical protein